MAPVTGSSNCGSSNFPPSNCDSSNCDSSNYGPITVTLVTVTHVTMALVTISPVTVTLVTVAHVTMAVVTISPVTVTLVTATHVTMALVTISPVTVTLVTVTHVTMALVTISPVTVTLVTGSSNCGPITGSSNCDPCNYGSSNYIPSNCDSSNCDPCNYGSSNYIPSNCDSSNCGPCNYGSSNYIPSNCDSSNCGPCNYGSSNYIPSNCDSSNCDPCNYGSSNYIPSNCDSSNCDPCNYGSSNYIPSNCDSSNCDSSNCDPCNYGSSNYDTLRAPLPHRPQRPTTTLPPAPPTSFSTVAPPATSSPPAAATAAPALPHPLLLEAATVPGNIAPFTVTPFTVTQWELRMERKRKKSSESLEKDDESISCADLNDSDGRQPGLSPMNKQNHSEIEKRRRDKMNTYITELSALIPMCSAMNRKLDKLTVLRMAVQHINSLKGTTKVCSEMSDKPSFISEDDLKQLILNVADGFLFVVGCDRGRILYVSESVKDILQYSQSDLIGQSLFDILHPRDISKVKEQLSSSDLTPRERLIDAKTMLPVKTEYPQKPTHLCSGARRSFFCHMKSAGKVSADLAASIKVKKELMETTYHRKRKSERKNFKVIHCTGYLKSWSKAKIGLDEDSEADNDCSILNCLVAIGREQPTYNPYLAEESSHIKVRSLEYMSRHNVDGKFTYVDERATVILGYLPQELLGTSVYEYYHQDDIPTLGQVHRKVLSSKEKIETDVYRFKLKNGKFIHLKSRCFGFRNPWTKEVEYIVSTNTVVHMQEVTSSGQMFDATLSLPEESNEFQAMDMMAELASSSKSTIPNIPGILGGTLAGAGRIGKQIADECMEQLNKTPSAHADSSNLTQANNPPHFLPPMVPNNFTLRPPTSAPTNTNSSLSSQFNSNMNNIISNNNNNNNNNHSTHIPSGSSNWFDVSHVERSGNGLSLLHTHSHSDDSSTEGSLIQSVMQEQTMDNIQNPGNDVNDEAALAFLMSLLEADAGLGGPVDFNDLPWPL
ncbi:basic helix-loop-helix ARNT-like protein 1 [Physella acuta]|uniref:basic helix-loop-helix ARNT-like protein 1 n=1 Tax=Physella acuta TaxID=109671 RepID=UPI0027DD50F0|nr:basic helix-loop-helix ARNT-like protein 1 [Physella acuta]